MTAPRTNGTVRFAASIQAPSDERTSNTATSIQTAPPLLQPGGPAVAHRDAGEITLAYISRERDEEVNAVRHAEARARRRSCFSIHGLRERAIDKYSEYQRYTHTEIVFRLDALSPDVHARYARHARSGDVLAIAAYGDKGVEIKPRPFTNDAYQYITLSCSASQFRRALEFAIDQSGKPYDAAGASWRLMLFPSAPTTSAWWCASLTHGILQKAGMLKTYPLNSLDVDNIVTLIEKSSRKRVSIPVQRHLIEAIQRVEADIFEAYPATSTAVSVSQIARDVSDVVDGSCREIVEREARGRNPPRFGARLLQ